jgi:hypothetical protein
MSIAERVAARVILASYFEVGDIVYFGKYKNKKGKIVRLFLDEKGHPSVEIQPIPQGRKKNKVFGLFKIWHAPPPGPPVHSNPDSKISFDAESEGDDDDE